MVSTADLLDVRVIWLLALLEAIFRPRDIDDWDVRCAPDEAQGGLQAAALGSDDTAAQETICE